MTKLNHLLMGGVLMLASSGLIAQPSIGGYNVYYGHLHNHCSISDGTGTPADAYNYAKTTGDLDFFSLADHSGSIDATEWTAMKAAADAANVPGNFTAFWGFEWTHNTIGHVAVINSTNYITTDSPNGTFAGLCDWLNANECVAFFNHPGRQNSTGLEFAHFTTTPSDKFVGMELWNKTDRFEDYYYNDGYYANDGNLGHFDEALSRGWTIGAAGSEDNHSGTWGTMTPSKLAVLATANTRADIMAALKARRFFTTYDKTMALSFKINGSEMGSTITGGNHSVQILASDAAGDNFTQVQLLRNGVVLNTWTPGTNTVNISQTLNVYDGEYYYVRVKQSDTDEAISSPVWVEGGVVNLPPSIQLTSPANYFACAAGSNLTITAYASDPDGSIAKVSFYQGSTLLYEDTQAPYSFSWENMPAGVYNLTAKATDNLGTTTISDPVTVIVYNPDAPNTRTTVIATGLDDVEESVAGVMYTTSTDIELVYDASNSAGNQIVGLKFVNTFIPQGAVITGAYLQFTCDETGSSACNLTIKGEAADFSQPFSSVTGNVSGRTTTSSSAGWTPAAWTLAGEAGAAQKTPDLSSIVQEIVNRAGYTPASPLTFIITGTGSRIAEAYEGVPASAAKLVVNYTVYSTVTPTFNPIGPLCLNSVPPALPATSTNGITGTWSPATISTSVTGTTVYTFTPAEGQHAVSTTLPITINPPVTPLFSPIGPLIQGAVPPVLPLTSANGITGTWNPSVISTASSGSYTHTFTPAAGQCALSTNMVIDVWSVVTTVLNIPIASGNDDVEEYNSGTMLLNSDDIELVYDSKTTGNQKVGLRFLACAIPQGATITRAYLQFTVDEVTTAATNLTIYGQDVDNSAAFATTKKNVSGRIKTSAYVTWSPGSWSEVNATQASQELKAVVQEIVDRPGWKSGNNMAFIITGTGKRTAFAYESGSAKAAVLHVEFSTSMKSAGRATGLTRPVPGRLSCFPVPFTDELQILFEPSGNEKADRAEVYNASGSLVKTVANPGHAFTLPMQEFTPGIYLIGVITSQNQYMRTVVKN